MSNFHANLSPGRLPAPHGSPSKLICIKGRISLEFEFHISISQLIPRTFRHFKHISLLTFLRNLICQEFPKVIVIWIIYLSKARLV